ncbi:MAG: hypothetical protein R6U88_03405 [Candidatus Bipolaricaulota bacterium]
MKGTVAVVAASNRRNSNSAAIGRYLAGKLSAAKVPTRSIDVADKGGLVGNFVPAVELVAGCRHAVLVASLYHDTINYMATATQEAWADRAPCGPNGRRPQFSAIIHSGYPEPVHTKIALDICRRFASEVDWTWGGGFTAGATSTIGGHDLDSVGPMGRNLRRALELSAQAIAAGNPIPEQAERAAARAVLPAWLFIPLANWAIRREAKRTGTRNIDARPYG